MILIDDRAGSGRDTRHPNGHVCRALASYPPLDTLSELTHLDAGDVCFTGNGPNGSILIGIEVKSISDLISSLYSHRLQGEQLPKMLEFGYDVTWLLYYGHYRPNPTTGALQIHKSGKFDGYWYDYTIGKRIVPYGYVESFLCSPSFTSLGILSKRATDIQEAATWIACLYRTWAKKWSEHSSMKVLYDNTVAVSRGANNRTPISTPILPPRDSDLIYRAGVASKLANGIGYEKAMSAAKYFQSVEDMVNATVDEWVLVPGIGKVLAKSIVQSIKRKST